jgi:hypothetical protein
MSKLLSGLVAAAFSGAIVLSAQEPAPRGGGQGAAGAGQASKTVTVAGCIQAAPPPAAGAPAAAGPASKFVLAMKPATGPGGGAPGAGAVGTSGSATRYQLEGEEKTISPHLNHQVEITGTLQGAPASATAAPTLKVESLKMISATCP